LHIFLPSDRLSVRQIATKSDEPLRNQPSVTYAPVA
jgi:hypothetical protein